MEVACVKGEPVVLRDIQSQVFTGFVKAINEKLGRIVLENVIQHPERIAITGNRNFDKDEIVELRSAKFEEINEGVVESSDSQTSQLMQEQKEKEKIQREYTLIKHLGSDYYTALSSLEKAPKIGLIALDTSKGRHKRASVISVSTPTNVYIFDLLSLGDDMFVEGLGRVLQSREVEKIVHDSRLQSDCLKQKHAVCLENIRDVEAEDIMVVYQDRKTIRRHRRTLEYLIKVYLGVEVEGLENEVWEERPLREDLLQNLANVISYLIPLQEAIQKKYMKRLIDASRAYNNFVRELDLFDYIVYEHEKTLRKEMIKVVALKSDIRGDGRPKVTS